MGKQGSPKNFEYSYGVKRGRLVVECGRHRVLVDTLARESGAAREGVSFAGLPIALNGRGGLCTDLRVDAVIGLDILGGLDVIVDPDRRRIIFDTGEPGLQGYRLPLEFESGVPTVTAGSIAGIRSISEYSPPLPLVSSARLFFSLGTSPSYLRLSEDQCSQLHPLGTTHIKSPGSKKRVEIPMFHVVPTLGDQCFDLRVGTLSALPEAPLQNLFESGKNLAGSLGIALLDTFRLHYAPRRRILALCLRRPPITGLERVPVPGWLAGAAEKPASQPLPLREILENSLYYPACERNGTPVKYLAGYVHSFVYVDYGVTREAFERDLNGTGRDSGFCGYHPVFQREVLRSEVVSPGWSPRLLPPEEHRERLFKLEQKCRPFGHWSIWRRNVDRDESHGPELFSFFFLAGEMSAAYQGLYIRLGIAPRILALIQTGAMGGVWEYSEANNSFFKEVIKANPAGMPKYLLHGSYCRFREAPEPNPCWTEYFGQRLCASPERKAGLWKLASG